MNTEQIESQMMEEKGIKTDPLTEKIEKVEILIFSLKGNYYSFYSKDTNEVSLTDKVFPLPLLPSYIKGIINRYSLPFSLIDLQALLNVGKSESNKIIVLKEQIDKVAFLIDDVIDIINLPVASIVKPEKADENDDELIEGFFEWKSTKVLILDVQKIINRIIADTGK